MGSLFAHLFENIFIILLEPLQCFPTCRLWIKVQTAFIVSQSNEIQLQFIHIKTKLVYIDKQITTSRDENDTWVNKNCKYNASNKRWNSNTTKVSLFGPTLYIQVAKIEA